MGLKEAYGEGLNVNGKASRIYVWDRENGASALCGATPREAMKAPAAASAYLERCSTQPRTRVRTKPTIRIAESRRKTTPPFSVGGLHDAKR